MNEIIKPPCATWGMWYGVEVEGQDTKSLGKKTLFIRRDSPQFPWRKYAQGMERIWFCKEWPYLAAVVEAARTLNAQVALEVDSTTLDNIPKSVLANPRIQIFFKVPVQLKPGDHICVGPAFADEAFMVGKNLGNKVKPEQYTQDICILP